MYQVPLEVYEQLAQATPEGKRDIVLRLIEEHPDHRLELPERDGLRADLSGVDLSREALQELVERRAGPSPTWWDAAFQGANLRNADLRGAILWGAQLQGARLRGANLQDAFLLNANLQDAHLWRANLQDANLRQANLQGATMWRANLERANLRDAQLQGVDLSITSSIRQCYLSGARLDGTRLLREQLDGAVGEELDGDYAEARVAYLGLKQNFDELGDYAASSWAYRKERRMGKREARKEGRYARRRHDWKEALSCYAKVFFDQTVELVCDYGEGVWRVLVCLALLWFDFAVFYGIMGHVLADRGPVYSTTRNLIDLLSFSLATMVTFQAPGLHVYPSLLMRILMPLQAALGIILLGLLGFVAGNRIRRS